MGMLGLLAYHFDSIASYLASLPVTQAMYDVPPTTGALPVIGQGTVLDQAHVRMCTPQLRTAHRVPRTLYILRRVF